MSAVRPSRTYQIEARLPRTREGAAELRAALEKLQDPPRWTGRLAPGSLAPDETPAPGRRLSFTYRIDLEGGTFDLHGSLSWLEPDGPSLVSLLTPERRLPLEPHGAQFEVDDWDFRFYRRELIEPLAALLGAESRSESLNADPDRPFVRAPETGHRRYEYWWPPSRYYDLRKPTRYFALEAAAGLSTDLCRRVASLVVGSGLLPPEAPVEIGGRPSSYGELLDDGLARWEVDRDDLGGPREMVGRGRVLLPFYLVREEEDGSVEASLVRLLLYPVPGDPAATRIHLTPESCHLHGVAIRDAPWSESDWDFRLYRDGGVRALCEGLPAKILREPELGRPRDETDRHLDGRESPPGEPYWPRYRARIFLGFDGEPGPETLR